MSRASRAWVGSAVATGASTYALDMIATSAGALLLASGLLSDWSGAAVLTLLAASYMAWGAALRPALAVNWDLLERTGISASLPSKAAHSLALRRDLSPRARRTATSLGYVGTELVKEAPYYLGAAGAALVTEAVSSVGVAVFLAGANFGAAAYELGLARLLRLVLARTPTPVLAPALAPVAATVPTYASFEADWDPAAYLADYYAIVEPDEQRTIAFLVEAAGELRPDQNVLVFGVGPTLHHVFPFALKARSIDLCDVLPANLAEVRRWLDAAPGAHDWRPFIRWALACEGGLALGQVTEKAIATCEEMTRARVARLLPADLREVSPLGSAPDAEASAYDVVVSAFCADSATDNLATWEVYVGRIAKLVRPGGTLVLAALRRSRSYRVGGRLFPSANVDEEDLRRALGPLTSSLTVEVCHMPDEGRHGYNGILLARGQTYGLRCEH